MNLQFKQLESLISLYAQTLKITYLQFTRIQEQGKVKIIRKVSLTTYYNKYTLLYNKYS